jgi:hypothetical protein
MDPRIRIHTKMSWIRNTGFELVEFRDHSTSKAVPLLQAYHSNRLSETNHRITITRETDISSHTILKHFHTKKAKSLNLKITGISCLNTEVVDSRDSLVWFGFTRGREKGRGERERGRGGYVTITSSSYST